MDLLQTILRTCGAEKYTENFKNNGIDAFTLQILNEEDLKIIGVEEVDVRELILKQASKLQIPSEKKINAVIDRNYATMVLNAMSMHLDKHFANLTYAQKRQDIDLCGVQLTPAVDCLEGCFTSLEERLTEFEEKVFKMENNRKKRRFHVILPTVIVTAAVLFACAKYFSLKR